MKLNEYDIKGVSQELIDFKNDATVIINFGKYQPQVLTGIPGWKANRGEFCWVVSATSISLYVYAATAGTTWTKLVTSAI